MKAERAVSMPPKEYDKADLDQPGITPPLISKQPPDSNLPASGHHPLVASIMRHPSHQIVQHGPDWVEYFAGGSAAMVNIAATFPINKLIFRQQLFSIRLPKAFKQLRQEGLRTLYRGVLPPLIQRTVTLSLMFGLYDQYTRLVMRQFPDCPLMAAQMLAAVFAGMVCTSVCTIFPNLLVVFCTVWCGEKQQKNH